MNHVYYFFLFLISYLAIYFNYRFILARPEYDGRFPPLGGVALAITQ